MRTSPITPTAKTFTREEAGYSKMVLEYQVLSQSQKFNKAANLEERVVAPAADGADNGRLHTYLAASHSNGKTKHIQDSHRVNQAKETVDPDHSVDSQNHTSSQLRGNGKHFCTGAKGHQERDLAGFNLANSGTDRATHTPPASRVKTA
jgi:hypothetical protein